MNELIDRNPCTDKRLINCGGFSGGESDGECAGIADYAQYPVELFEQCLCSRYVGRADDELCVAALKQFLERAARDNVPAMQY